MTRDEYAAQLRQMGDEELRAEVGARIFAFTDIQRTHSGNVGGYHPDGFWCTLPHYPTDIAAAWEVAEKLNMLVMPSFGWGWCAQPQSFADSDNGLFSDLCHVAENMVTAYTAPRAICIAACLAVFEGE